MSMMTSRFDTPKMKLALGLIVPLVVAALILILDYLEGPKVAFAGVAACVGFMAAVFGGPRRTIYVVVLVEIGAYLIGLSSEDSGAIRQDVRLGLIGLTGVIAVFYSLIISKREQERDALVNDKVELEGASRLAMFDQLTGLFNRRGVLEALENEERWPRSVAILDLDKLKHINDSLGHNAGDDFIQIVAQRIQRAVSAKDIVGRWGGDEFIVVLPLDLPQAAKVMARVIAQVSGEPIASGKVKIEPRLSGGVAEWLRSNTLEHTLLLADHALYEAKGAGGNQVVAHTLEVPGIDIVGPTTDAAIPAV